MSNYMNAGAFDITQSAEYQQELSAQRTFMARVYGWMSGGLIVTAITAFAIAYIHTNVTPILSMPLMIGLIIAQFAIALGFGFVVNKMPAAVAAVLFLVYAGLMGVTCAVLLMVYTKTSVASTFIITAGMFGGMSAFGYLTKRDLTGLGYFCMMGFWGVLLASIVHFVLMLFTGGSFPMLSFLISVGGVIVFTGLAAFDTQRIKQSYADHEYGSDGFRKTAIFGAFILYLDFINLFIFLLRLLGSREE